MMGHVLRVKTNSPNRRGFKGGERMLVFEIYFDDLHEEAQRRYLEFQGVEDPAELNAELSPICIIERSDDDEADDEGD